MFGVETVRWTTGVKTGGKRYGGVLETLRRFMHRWPRTEAEMIRLRHASENTMDDGVEGIGDGGATVGTPL